MQNNATAQDINEIRVNTRDLWLNTLLRWRWIVVITAIAGILGLGLSIISAYKDSKAALESPVELTPELEEKYKNIDALQASYDEQQTYLAESLLMNIDPLHKWVYTAQYYVVMDPELPVQPNVGAVIAQYLTELKSEQTCEAIRLTLGENTASSYITELIVATNMGNNYFNFIVSSENADDAQKMGDSINSIITTITPAVEKNFGSHTLIMNGNSCYEMVDSELLNLQRNKINDAQGTLNNITAIQNGFTEEELEIIDAYEASKNSPDFTSNFNIVTVILAIAGGVVLSLLILAIYYIFNNKLHCTDPIWQDSNIYHIGSINIHTAKKRLSHIDIALVKFFSPYYYSLLSCDASLTLCKLCDILAQKQLSSVCITGTMMDSSSAFPAIKEILSHSGLSLTYLPNIAYDTTSFQTACQARAIVLLESVGSSDHEEILRIITLCHNHQIDIIGSITTIEC